MRARALPGAYAAVGRAHRWTPVLLDALRGIAVLASTSDLREHVLPAASPAWRVDLLVVGSAAAAAAARRFPVPALVVAAVLDALPYWLPVTGLGYHLAFMICLYMAASRCPPRTAVVAVSAAYVVQLGLMAHDRGWLLTDFFVLFVAMSNLAALALGLAVRARRATLAALQARAEEAERSRESEARKRVAEDRLRVARDLHDSVAHQIAVMSLNTAVASAALPGRPDDAQRALDVVHEAGRSVLTAIGELLAGLRDESGDVGEPRYSLDELRVLVEEFRLLLPLADLDLADLDLPPPSSGEPRSVSAATYLVVREGLTNALKHGTRDRPVELDIRLGTQVDAVRLRNAVPDRPADAAAGSAEGFGLRGMRERLAAVGGELEVVEADGTFTVSARVPHQEAAR